MNRRRHPVATATVADRDRILDHVVRASRELGGELHSDHIARVTELDEDSVVSVLLALRDDGYITGQTMVASPGRMLFVAPTPKTLDEGGAAPVGDTAVYERLLDAIHERIAVEPDADTRDRLDRLHDAIAETGPRLMGELLVAAVSLRDGAASTPRPTPGSTRVGSHANDAIDRFSRVGRH